MARPEPMVFRVFQATLLLGSVLLLATCRGGETTPRGERPNVILISVDTLRADHTSVYGYHRETTPNLERFAADAAVFDVAYSTTSTTAPSHASLLTGLYPTEHRVRKNAVVLEESFRTLAEIFRDGSYQTAGVVSSFIMERRFGWMQGFDHYEDSFDLAGTKERNRIYRGVEVPDGFDQRGAVTHQEVLDLLQRLDGDAPFFLFVHYFDPHEPYAAPPPFDQLFPVDAEPDSSAALAADYDREVAYLDHQLGGLFDYLDQEGLAESTLVAVTADHGQGLMQHGQKGHGAQIYEPQVRVPWIVRWPGRIAPRRVGDLAVSSLDVGPTLLGLVGLEVADVGGRDLSPLLLSDRAPTKAAKEHPVKLYRQHFLPQVKEGLPVAGEQFGLVSGPWKLVFAPDERRVELYRLDRDPGELNNLAAQHPERVQEMLEILQPSIDQRAPVDLNLDLSDEEREGLEALGYTE